jgi:hypothetical protein
VSVTGELVLDENGLYGSCASDDWRISLMRVHVRNTCDDCDALPKYGLHWLRLGPQQTNRMSASQH